MDDTGIHVSIIIPSLNEEKHIGKCLDSIIHVNSGQTIYEVILVDNGSTDQTCNIAAGYKDRFRLDFKILRIPGVTVSALRNIGVSHSRGGILAFLDADCAVSTEWLGHALKHFDDPAIDVVGFGYEIPEESSWVARAWDLNPKRTAGPADYLPSGNLFVRRTSFLEIGGFNENLRSNEDFDLCVRLRKMGAIIFADPSIRVTHWGEPQTLKDFFNKQKWHGTHVFKVFLSNIRELNNLKAIAYAFYFLFFGIFFIIGLLLFLIRTQPLYMTIPLIAFLIPPYLASFKILRRENFTLGNVLRLGFLYLIYGFARAGSILNLK